MIGNKRMTPQERYVRYKDRVEKWSMENKGELIKVKKIYRSKNFLKEVLAGAKNRATKENVPFNLTLEDLIVPDICPVLGIPIRRGKGKIEDNSPALDRFIPEAGYVRGNVNFISARANRIKSSANIEEVYKLLDWMIRTQEKYEVA